jgi:hypothetical protein
MLLKLVHYTVTGIALFYMAENTGLIERGKYFPTLPRLEASASDPMAWIGAVTWGVSHLTQVAGSAAGTQVASGGDVSRPLSIGGANSFTERLTEQREAAERLIASYRGS